MKQLTLGILAHVDAGKTTLSEAMLYLSGAIRKAGRVDNRDAFLDTYELERERGITIFSKQAVFAYDDLKITLLDTPGHVDFSAEMERTLQVLDAAVLVIGASDGVQGHTVTLWKLLKRYQVPVFLFVNKMDQQGTDQDVLMRELCDRLGGGLTNFSEENKNTLLEELAMCDEELLNCFLEKGDISEELIRKAIAQRKVFPCFFGSALKLFGVRELMEGIVRYMPISGYPKEFGARVFKITRDNQGNRLTHMKITGGCLKARDVLKTEKVNQIRIYSGEKFDAVNEACAGQVCAVTGLLHTFPGQGFGLEKTVDRHMLEPVLSYCIYLPEGCDPAAFLPKLMQLQEEDPTLQVVWDEELKEIHAKVMGEVQIEILKHMIRERFGIEVSFGTGRIVYKETIADRVEGVGHFEPLRHYAEVHLLLEPAEPGSGLLFAADCSEDILARNWQRLILTHLEEKEHRGVLTGSPITDMKITLVSGRAHLKHTEGGDFRQATYRAVRQGLMEASGVLLEPVYEFRLEIPEEMIGRAMTDMEKLHSSFTLKERVGGVAVLTGTAPVVTIQDYQKEVTAYTRGHGRLSLSLKGYVPCHNAEEVIAKRHYDPESDLKNPTGSVFCAHGAGFVVPWNQVKDYMHLESCFAGDRECVMQTAFEEELERRKQAAVKRQENTGERGKMFIGTDEIDAIIGRTARSNSRSEFSGKREGWQREKKAGGNTAKASETRIYKGQPKKEKYLLVDGYNVIFAWEDLKELAGVNLDGARGKLLDILCNYQAIKGYHLMAVFDAYKLKGHGEEIMDYHNIQVVYTKEAETADRFIEKFAHENAGKYDVTVVTSDGLEQIIIVGAGCQLVSSREFRTEVELASKQVLEDYQRSQNR
ncbi:MAG: TetM/TetW/TetO/TetS family tetracycline resistance ribosomal protection protein [Lachnospiraceae bacterium]|nr:TetM/TetW/TetO/TetS family tetracycline resistance ribosomal protection protein [Lachnospiraceae bacterium]MDD7627406.1 TetM/TetW/TetO/TetS family tetracycline resistance ribosomal protection protein [Lachnospiraceae bacterium]MDY4119518.1 translation factor GTPase family protein [Lachnospiraceae bacterium]